MVAWWFTILYILNALMRNMWRKDVRTAVSGGDGVELWPRKLATAKFRLDDMRTVKDAVAGAVSNYNLFDNYLFY